MRKDQLLMRAYCGDLVDVANERQARWTWNSLTWYFLGQEQIDELNKYQEVVCAVFSNYSRQLGGRVTLGLALPRWIYTRVPW